MQKTRFQRGSVVSPTYLNAIQDSIKFTAAPRANLYGEPTNNEQRSFDLNHRDGLKDWEIDPRSVLGRHSHGGIVLGSDGSLIVYGPPATTRYLPLRDLETDELLGLDSSNQLPSGSYGIVIEGGSMVSPQGEAWSWPRDYFVVNGSQTLYAIFHGGEQQLMLVPQIPSRSLPFCLLSKIEINPQGILTVTDLRPATHLDNLFTYRQALTNTAAIDEDVVATPWQRIMADTRYGSIIITLNSAAALDSDEIAIVDLYNSFATNPVILRPDASDDTLLQNSPEDIVLGNSGAITELYFHEEFKSWRFKSDYEGFKAPVAGEFKQCGGVIYGATSTAEACPHGEPLPLDPRYGVSLGVYSYDSVQSKCNLVIDPTTSVYYSNNNTHNYEINSMRCGGSISPED